jgi:hypothetical protein
MGIKEQYVVTLYELFQLLEISDKLLSKAGNKPLDSVRHRELD